MSGLFEALITVLRQQGMAHTVSDGREIAEARFNGGRFAVTMRCLADARTDRPMLLCYSTLDERVPERRRAAVAEYFNQVNSSTWIGSFELVRETGEARFRTGIDFGEQRPTADLVLPVVVLNVAGINARLPHLCEVIDGDDEVGAAYVAYR
jgi:hypothetical protein